MTFANMDDIVGSLRACKSTLPAIVVSIGILYVIIGAIRRVYFSPLSKFPGSKLAALTLWNEFYWDIVKRGTFIWRIEEMHKKYGKATPSLAPFLSHTIMNPPSHPSHRY